MNQDEFFSKGFNFGYILAKHDPDLSRTMSTRDNANSPFFQGLVWGKKEFEKELALNKNQELNKIRTNKKSIDRDLDRT